MNLVFLDFDGVCHFADVARINGEPEILEAGYRLFEWTQPLADILSDFQNVRIALSTSWVSILGFDRTKSYLPERIRQRVIGATFHSAYAREFGITKRDWSALTRYQQVALYLARNQVDRWVALDDDDEGWPDSMRDDLIYCNPELGLSEPDVVEQLRKALAQS